MSSNGGTEGDAILDCHLSEEKFLLKAIKAKSTFKHTCPFAEQGDRRVRTRIVARA